MKNSLVVAFVELFFITAGFIVYNIFDPQSDLFYQFCFPDLLIVIGIIWIVSSTLSLFFQSIQQTMLNITLAFLILIAGLLSTDYTKIRDVLADNSKIDEPIKQCLNAKWCLVIEYIGFGNLNEREEIFFNGDELAANTKIENFIVDMHKKHPKYNVVKTEKILMGAPKAWLKENNLSLDLANENQGL